MKTIVEANTGKVLFAVVDNYELQDGQVSIDLLLTEKFVNPYYDFTTLSFYEKTDLDGVNNYVEVPQEVQLWRIRTILKLLDLEQTVENSLNSLSEPTKTAALYIWNYGTTVERYSNTVLFIQSTLQMTDAQVDDIFIQSQNIQL